MQDEVDRAWNKLLAAMGDLRLIPDKDLLEELISQAQAVMTAGFTTRHTSTGAAEKMQNRLSVSMRARHVQ